MRINNHHPERIAVVINGVKYELFPHSSIEIATSRFSICCQLIHSPSLSDWSDTPSDKLFKAVTEATALVVDSTYRIDQISEDTVIDVTNEIFAYEKEDVCIVYHGVTVKNAKIELTDCCCPNAKKFMRARKLLLLSDANDFPVISPIVFLFRYHRLKKILSYNHLRRIVCHKTKPKQDL